MAWILERQFTNLVELEELDGSPGWFEDIYFMKIHECRYKKEIREYIDKHQLYGNNMRVIAPGGAVSDYRKIIKFQKPGIKEKSVDRERKERDMHRITDRNDPILIPKEPTGRMRLIKRAIEQEEGFTEEELNRIEERMGEDND